MTISAAHLFPEAPIPAYKTLANVALGIPTALQLGSFINSPPISDYLPSSTFPRVICQILAGSPLPMALAYLRRNITTESSTFSLSNIIVSSVNLFSVYNQFISYYFPNILDCLPNSTMGKIAIIAPIYLASLFGIKKIVETTSLNDTKAEVVNGLKKNGATTLTDACYLGKSDLVKLLLTHKDIDGNKKDQFGNTPLIAACKFGHIESVKLLLADKNIDVMQLDDKGLSALHHAYVEKYDVIVKLILEHLKLSEYVIDSNTSYIYAPNHPLLLSAKSFVHLIFTPVHALCVVGKEMINLAIDLGITAFYILANFGNNLVKFGLISSFTFFAHSIVFDLSRTLFYDTWKIKRVSFLATGMLFASIYGIIFPKYGRNQLNHIAGFWGENTLLWLTGLNNVAVLHRDT